MVPHILNKDIFCYNKMYQFLSVYLFWDTYEYMNYIDDNLDFYPFFLGGGGGG